MADKRTRWIIEATSNIPDINNQLERLIKLQQTQNELTQQNTSSTALAIQRQREQIEQLTNAQSKSNTTTAQGVKQQTDGIGTLRKEYDLLSKQLSGLVQLAAGAWAVGQLKTYVMEVIAAKSAQDGFVASMEQMLGSRLKAEELNAKLIAIALKSPFQIDQLQEVTKKLQGMGVETEKLIPYINMLGDIAAIVGTQKLPLIAKALTDVQSKHVLMAQEIRQFTDNGVPLYDLLAKSMQKPVEEIRKLATEHKIVFADVEKALMQATEKGGIYYGQMAVQAKQLGGQVSNLGDLYTQAKAKIGDYFENGLRSGIKATGEFITATIGSENAITRTITALKAALAVWISYRTAVLTVEAAKRANNVTTLAGLAGIEASTVATVGLTGVTTSLSGAFNGLKVAFMANPFGMIATAVTSLISIFYAYKAVNIEVAEAQSIEAEALRKTNTEISNNIERVKGMTVGTAERKKAIEDLIAKYPELFKNLDAESIGNAQLETVLKRVNAQYREKIQLAILDAKNNVLLEKQIDLEKQRYEIIKKLREENGEVSMKFADDSQFVAELNRRLGTIQSQVQSSLTGVSLGGGNLSDGGVTAQMISNAKLLESETKKVQAEITKNFSEQSGVRVKIDAAEQNQKLTELRRQLRNHEISVAEFNKKVEDLNKESVDKVVKKVEEGEGKKQKAQKTTLELSLENDIKELKSMDQTFAVKMQLLNKQEALAIEQAKRTLTNREQEEERILSIQKEYDIKRGKLALESATAGLADMKQWFDAEVDAHKIKYNKIFAMSDAEKIHWAKNQKEIQTLRDQNTEIEIRNEEKKLEANVIYRAEILKNERSFWKDREELYLEGMAEEQNKNLEKMRQDKEALEQRAAMLKDAIFMQKEYEQVRQRILELEGKITEEELKNFQTNEALVEKKMARAKEYFNMAMAFVQEMSAAELESYSEAWDAATEAVDNFYDYAMEANKKSFEYQIANSRYSLDAMTAVWQEYSDRQMALLNSKQDFDTAAASMKNVIDNMKEVDQNMTKFTQLLSEGKWLGAVVNAVTNIFTTKKRLAEATAEMEKLAFEQKLADFDQEIALIDQLLVAQKKAIQDAYDAKVEAINKEISAEEDKYAKLQAAAEQYYSDNQLRLQKDDQYRAELVAAGEAREVAYLEAAKQRQITAAREKGASDEEVARITIAFDALIADKHKEYQEAIGNVSKETSLANQEVKAQEADAVGDIQDNLQQVLDKLRTSLYDAQVQMQQAMVHVAYESAQAQIRIEEQKFEAMRQFAISELEVAAKKALGKGDGKGHATAMVAIEQIRGMVNPFTDMLGPRQIFAPGITQDSRPPRSGRPGEGIGGSGDAGPDGGGPRGSNGPRGGFHGDTWLRRDKWDPDAKYDMDGIYMRTQEGERLMPLYLNQFLGPKVTNQELVHGYLQYANFKDRLPDTSVPNIPQMIMPDFSQSNQNVISMDNLEKEIREMRNVFASKSLVKINIDGNAVKISEEWAQHKATYYDTLFNQ
jgi:tape measure domain-containing protein